MTVCPPKDTNTALNSDLVKAENSTLDKEERKHLIILAGELLQDKEFEEIFEEENAFEEKRKFRNWEF